MTEIEKMLTDLDNVRAGFERAGSRPRSAVLPPRELATPETLAAVRRARGRLRTAVYRGRLDQRAAPPAEVVGLALLAAVVRIKGLAGLDDSSLRIVQRAFADLIGRGYERREIEAVFRRFRNRLAEDGTESGVERKTIDDPTDCA